jgi:4'-phosphopantetheinyl transferase
MFRRVPLPLTGEAEVVVGVAALTDIPLDAAMVALTPSERGRALGYKLQARTAEFAKTRAVLRWVLGWCTGRDPHSFVISEGENGAPCLAGDGSELFCNASHSAGQAMVAVSRAPLGVDIEQVREDIDCLAIADACYHSHERAQVQAAEGHGRVEMFFDIWTRKEAYLKATGTGLSAELTAFSTMAANDEIADDGAHGTWHVRPIRGPAGYRAALATRRSNPRLIRLRCSGDGRVGGDRRRAAA